MIVVAVRYEDGITTGQICDLARRLFEAGYPLILIWSGAT
jgi:hypothetical protein